MDLLDDVAAAATSSEKYLGKAATAARAAAPTAAVLIAVFIVVTVAVATMPYWLPEILKQSGMANSTLYEARAYIDFQGASGSSCDRANFGFYPYCRKDLGGSFWNDVGGDRGRACLPERYTAQIYLPTAGTLALLQGSKQDRVKHMKIFGIEAEEGKSARFVWGNA